MNRLSDLSFADAWLREYTNGNLGTSIVVARNKEAENLINDATSKGFIDTTRIPAEKVAESQSLKLVRRRFGARMSVAKRSGKNLPTYSEEIPKHGTLDFIRAMRFYGLNYAFLNERSWLLLDWLARTS